MKITVRRGLDIPVKGGPPKEAVSPQTVARVGLLASDHPGLRPEMLVSEGDAVLAGTPVYRDRRRPDIVFVSPVSGRIEEIAIGARRRMTTVVIAVQGTEPISIDTAAATNREGVRALLLGSGLWPQVRTRPFERIPDPAATPDAIFVTATDTSPHAVDPHAVLSERREDLSRGVEAIARLTDGPLFFCQPDAAPLIAETGTVKLARFAGPHPAGLVGTHIARLFPLHGKRVVWHIEAQDVAAFGALLGSGHVDPLRTISVSGPGVRAPRRLRVPMGADLHALVRDTLTPGQKKILSGSAIAGRDIRYLSRYHRQVTALDVLAPPRRNWLLEALHKVATVPAFIPTQALENAIGPDIAATPLLRALSIGDSETAQRLGVLQLAEEDLALATYVTGGAVDFGARLRTVLDTLEGAP